MRIYFDARYDLDDISCGSGSYFFLIRHLRQLGAKVITGTPVILKRPWHTWLPEFYCRRVTQTQYRYFLEPAYAKRLAHALGRKVRGEPFDVLFTNDRNIAAYYPGHQPVVLVSDNIFRATVASGGYERYRNLCGRSLRGGDHIQSRALRRALMTFVPSEYVREHAIRSHGGDPAALHFVPWGANLFTIPSAELHPRRGVPDRTCCRLLTVGLDWDRKQGNLTVAVRNELRRRGIASHLTVVGMSPPAGLPADINAFAPLTKAKPGECEKLSRLYASAHFFILPTLAEGYGMVFVEAAAHALPSLGFRLTGVTSSVRDGASGILIEPGSGAEAFADALERLLDHPDDYLRLCRSAREFYETEANWPLAARRILDIVSGALESA